VIAGGDSNDPGSAGKSFYYTPDWYQKITEFKIGFAEIDFSDWVDEPLRPAFANALSVVKSIGPQMVETRLPDFPYGPVIGTIIDSEAASIFEVLIRSGQVDTLADGGQIAGLKASMNYSAVDYLKAMRVRSQVQDAFRKVFADLDLLLAPTRFNLPDRSDQPFDETPRKHPDQRGVGSGLVQASNLCGLPALTIPCGFVNGLPIGLQIVGPPFTENRLIAFAREFQKRTDFHKQHPPMPTIGA
jgi:aspartyl-tRNA(Asn)/glutamyl-tRNA(Gln) amidotransferase subunit A